MEICPKCGLPEQACVCENIVKSSQRIRISTDKKRYGKVVTVVNGFDKGIDIKKTAKALKNEFACGGTFDKEAGMVELQGEHVQKVKPFLVKLGFEADSIDTE
jgi:translation initiation factor 1